MGKRAYNLVVPMGQADGLFPGMAALYNDQPGAVVQVRRVRLLPPGGQRAVGIGTLEVQRIFGAYPDHLGDSLTIPAVKSDTAAADSPLYAWTSPLFGSSAVVEVISRFSDTPAGSQTVALAPMSVRQALGGCGRMGFRTSQVVSCRAASGVEPVRLTYGGHAIAITQTQSGLPHAARVEIVLRSTTTGATYLYVARVNTGVADPLKPLVAIWSGGGDTWDVKRVDFIVDAQATPLTGLRLVKMEGDHANDLGVQGAPIVPSPHDTLFPCPNGIRGAAGVLRSTPFGRSAGVPFDYDRTHGIAGWTVVSQLQAGRVRRVVRPTPGIEAGSTLSTMQVQPDVVYDGAREIGALTLRYQQSLILCDGVGADLLPSTYAAGEVNFEFTVTDDGSSSPGISYVS